ncbi:syntaxin-6 isoform X1 [Apodemus sylvaticus]|uniref:syntaxin-6 isoform X1 n=1 Tax=Apodemus sylvaticus TaxID=10129 RepID=UPI002242B616|nr:syntaxin-6 isoform X1 [Apodemus sylvaticus]
MSMEDPFFVVKGEVQKAVNTAQGLFQRWTELLQGPSAATREEIDWTTNELRNNLRSIEWDLEDLDETISIVEANPRKFNLDATELSIRKAFITSTRQIVRDMKDQMSSSSVQALAERKNRQALLGDSSSQNWNAGVTDRYGRLDRELQLANSHFIEEQQAQQQLIVEQQDEQLELVSGSIGVLKNMSQRIGGELEEQAVMLDDFSHELESTQSRLDNVMKKLAKVSHMTSGHLCVLPCRSAPVVCHSHPLRGPGGRADPLPSAVMVARLRRFCTRTQGRGEASTPPLTFLSQKHTSARFLCDSSSDTALSPVLKGQA